MTVQRVLVVTGGHPVDLDAMAAMFDALAAEHGWDITYATQPTAQDWLHPHHAGAWDVIVLHDIVGLHLRRGEPPRAIHPTDEQQAALLDMLRAGQPLVVTHHSLASWPSWDAWAEALGGRFNYAPGMLRGTPWPSSGTTLDTYRAHVEATDHPVCAGLTDFELSDELYCCPIFEHEVIPLLRAATSFAGTRFVRTFEHVISGAEHAPDCAEHPPASNLIAWAKAAINSPLVYIQPGDSAATFALEPYRKLMANAIRWVGSVEARAWTRSPAGQQPSGQR